MPTLLLVDDHAMLRGGLREALAKRPGFTIAGESSTGRDAMEKARELRPEVILMDVHLPDTSGVETSRQILEECPETKIIIVSSDAGRSLVDEALKIGVGGYVAKTGSVEEVILAIESVLAGKLYLSPDVSGGILGDYKRSLSGLEPQKPLLSQRDIHLLRLIAEGHRNKEISAEMKVSVKSVEAYRSRLMKKLACASSAELVRYAVREGISKA
jgi:two-component system response regulator NreC